MILYRCCFGFRYINAFDDAFYLMGCIFWCRRVRFPWRILGFPLNHPGLSDWLFNSNLNFILTHISTTHLIPASFPSNLSSMSSAVF